MFRILGNMAQDTPEHTPVSDRKPADRRPQSTEHALVEPDASKYIGFSCAWLRQRRQREDGGPPFIRAGRSIRYRVEDLNHWLDAHRVSTTRKA